MSRHTSTQTELTDRETEVLKLLCRGLALKEVADALSISVKNVEKHAMSVRDKFRNFEG